MTTGRQITIGPSENLGVEEYRAFSKWYIDTYKVEPPPNDESILGNRQYAFWKDTLKMPGFRQIEEVIKQEGVALPSGGTALPPPLSSQPTTPATPSTPEVTSFQGYDWTPLRDLEGNITSWDLIGRTGDYVSPELAQRQKEFESTVEERRIESQADRAARASEAETLRRIQEAKTASGFRADLFQRTAQRAAGAQRNLEFDIEQRIRGEYATKFEDMRRNLADSPRNFYLNQVLRTMPNPYEPRQLTGQQEISSLRQDLADQKVRLAEVAMDAAAIDKDLKDPTKGLTDDVIKNPRTIEERNAADILNRRDEAARMIKILQPRVELAKAQIEASGEATPRMIGGVRTITGSPAQPVQQTFRPPAFVQPTHEQFRSMSPTEREKMYGLAELHGKKPEDILFELERTIPVETRKIRQAPAIQR